MRARWLAAAIASVALVAALGPSPAHAQKPKRSTAAIRQQLEESVRLQQAALGQLASPDIALKLTLEAYVRLRAGHSDHKLNLAYQNVKNPVDELANPRFEKARWHLLRARTILTAPNQVWEERIPWHENVTNHLRASMHQIELVLAIAF